VLSRRGWKTGPHKGESILLSKIDLSGGSMKKAIRSYLFLPLAAILLVAIPALLFSLTGHAPTVLAQTIPAPTATGTIPPVITATPTGTIPSSPLPTPVPTRRPVSPLPRPVQAVTDGRIRVGGEVLEKVIGNRLSPTIYGFTFSGVLYRTPNNGRTWALVTRTPDVDEFLMSPADPYVLYSTYPLNCRSTLAAPLYRSDDGGLTWDDVEPDMSLLPLLADPDDSDVVIAAACDGIYITEDGGFTWSALSTADTEPLWDTYVGLEMESSEGSSFYLRANSATGESVILYSEDGGETWAIISPEATSDPLSITSLAVDPYMNGYVWFAESQGVWSTEDLGQFWGLSSAGLSNVLPDGLNDVIIHTTDQLFLATEQGFYSKSVGSTRWTKLGRETVALDVFNFLFTDSLPSRLWLNTENGVYRYLVR
jgi:hypothetical protein